MAKGERNLTAMMLAGLRQVQIEKERKPDKVDFERFHKVVFESYRKIFRRDLSPMKATQPLSWIGLVHEQEHFYVSYGFGVADEEDTPQLTRIDAQTYPDCAERLQRRWDDLLAPGLPVKLGDLDEEDVDDAKRDTKQLATLAALGLLARELQRNPRKMIAVPISKKFRVTVSGDRETPDWAERVPSIGERDEAVRKKVLEMLCSTPAMKKLFRSLMAAGDRRGRVDLLKAIG